MAQTPEWCCLGMPQPSAGKQQPGICLSMGLALVHVSHMLLWGRPSSSLCKGGSFILGAEGDTAVTGQSGPET